MIKRRVKPPRPIRLRQLESRYYAGIMVLMRQYEQAVMEYLYPAIPTIIIHQDDETDTLTAALNKIKEFVRQLTNVYFIGRPAQQAAAEINTANARYHGELMGKLLGVQPIVAEPWLGARVKAFVAENVSLISTLPKEGTDDIEQMLYREQRRNLSVPQLRAKIVEQFGVTRGRAQVIARDQVAKFNASLTQTRQTNLGIEEYTWRTVEDGRVRSDHRHLDGEVFKWSEPPVTVRTGKRAGERNHPGQDIQCFDGSVLASNYSPVHRLFRRWYSGEFTKLITSSGESLDCTANHPVLTKRGWVSAKLLNVGDQVFSIKDQRTNVLNGNAQQAVSFNDYFSAFSLVLPVETSRVFGSQFHGDLTVDQEVDIINIDTLLSNEANILFFQNLRKFFFSVTEDDAFVSLDRLRSTYLLGGTPFGASGSNIGGLCQFFSFLFTQAGHSDVVAIRNAPSLHASTFQPVDNSVMRNIKFGGYPLETHSASVQADHIFIAYLLSVVCESLMPDKYVTGGSNFLAEIVGMDAKILGDLGKVKSVAVQPPCFVDNVRSYFNEGHVFTFETKSGWYVAENIIVQNCRCYAEPIIEVIKQK